VMKDPARDQSSLLRNVPNAFVAENAADAALSRLLLTHGSVGRA
jgi:hypothetical protein